MSEIEQRVRTVELEFGKAMARIDTAVTLAKWFFGGSGIAFLLTLATVIWTAIQVHSGSAVMVNRLDHVDRSVDKIEARLSQPRSDAGSPMAYYASANGGPTTTAGIIERIVGAAVTVALYNPGHWECQIGPHTVIKIDGKRAEAKDLKTGMGATFFLTDRDDKEPLLVQAFTPHAAPPVAAP